jgi:ribosome maturation factor RimP
VGQRPAFFIDRNGLGSANGNGRIERMALSQVIERIITPTVEGMGYELVRLTLSGGQRKTLQVMAEPKDGRHMSLEDCTKISRAISAVLDVEDPIEGAYSLEVSSPGIDRPLTRPKDYERFAGFEAKLETRAPIDGRKRFKGRLRGLEAGQVKIEVDGATLALPLEEIDKAKLVLTDDLIAAYQQAEQAQELPSNEQPFKEQAH